MKILVFSDSHSELRYLRAAILAEKPQQVLHLGDHAADAELLSREFPLLPFAVVRGNCDWSAKQPLTRLLTLDGTRYLLCHGHTYHVKDSLLSACYAAREQRADVLLFGHTHIPYFEQTDGLILLNPGCCYGRYPSYAQIISAPGQPPKITLKSPEVKL